MSTAFYLMIGSGIVLIALLLLFKAESSSGKRLFLSSLRNKLDINLVRTSLYKKYWVSFKKTASIRLLLHFIVHHILGAVLFTVRAIEGKLNKLRRHNRLIAKSMSSKGHLHHIAKHREETALSVEEKEALKERSLND